MTTTFAMAVPADPADRERLRQLVPGGLPIVVPGSEPRPCRHCGLILGVGPRVRAALEADPSIVLLCPMCAVIATGGAARVEHLGNPDSRGETPGEVTAERQPPRRE